MNAKKDNLTRKIVIEILHSYEFKVFFFNIDGYC